MSHTITNQYLAHHSKQIHLRVHRARHVERNRDLRGAEGILLATVIGTAVISWTVALIRWFL
jgi:hypothetical protein